MKAFPVGLSRGKCAQFAVVLTVATLPGCGPEEVPDGTHVPPEVGFGATPRPGLERASYIARVQAEASTDYSLPSVRSRSLVRRLAVDVGKTVDLTTPTGERFSLSLSRYGCAGDLRDAPPAIPTVSGNRAEYRRGAKSPRELAEWYVHGPLGLEQGFTVERDQGCAGRGLELDVGVTGMLTPELASEGSVTFASASGRRVARYSELYATDATGRELRARLEVRNASIRIHVDDSAATYPIRIDPLVAIEETKLHASDGAPEDHFGGAIDISGDTAVIGAPGANAAYVFRRSGEMWLEEAILVTDDGAELGRLAVAISGDTIVLGARSDNAPGAAYVFVRESGNWLQEMKLVASDGGPGDYFGYSVAISGDTIVAGAPSVGVGVGAMYVFVGNDDVWTEQAKLVASDPQPSWPRYNEIGTTLGVRVAISGDTAVACSWGHDEWGIKDTGAAYVFVRNAASWTEQAKLVASDAASNSSLCEAMALSGDTVVANASYPHSAYVFVRTGDVWTEQAALDVPNATIFRPTVTITNNVIVLGDILAGSVGAAYLYERVGNSWSAPQSIQPSDGSFEDYFGNGVAMSDDLLLVGATSDDDLGSKSGSVYAFRLRLSDGSPCAAAGECASLFCVDGVCCDAACDAGPCDACSTELGAVAAGVCTNLTGPVCDDGNACTQVDACSLGTCIGTNATDCPSDACHDGCNPLTGQCEPIEKPNGTPCDDANACTSSDSCQAGVCSGGDEKSCPAFECHGAGVCMPATGDCDTPMLEDGTPCSTGVCTGGQCQPPEPENTYVVGDGCACKYGTELKQPFMAEALLVALIALTLRRKQRTV